MTEEKKQNRCGIKKYRTFFFLFLCFVIGFVIGWCPKLKAEYMEGYQMPGDGFVTEEFIEAQEEKEMGTYSIKELEDYFYYETIGELGQKIERWNLKNIEERFPGMVHRFSKNKILSYSVCEVKEGGRYFAMQKSPCLWLNGREVANYEEGWNSQAEGIKIEGLKNIRMWGKVGIYITRLCTEEDFAEIIPGWSSFADIKNIDPYAETTLTSAGLNRIRSVLADGNIMIFEHMKGYQTNPEDVIPYEKGVYNREDSGSDRTMEQIEVRDLEPFLNEEGKFRLLEMKKRQESYQMIGDGIITEEFVNAQEEKEMGTYSLDELEEYFGYQTLEEFSEKADHWQIQNIEKQFPKMIHRFNEAGIFVYSVCEVKEGGRYFVMQCSPNLVLERRETATLYERDAVDWERLKAGNMEDVSWGKVGIHLTQLHTAEEMEELCSGIKTIEDVKQIEPYVEVYFSRPKTAGAILADGTKMEFSVSRNHAEETRQQMLEISKVTERRKRELYGSKGADALERWIRGGMITVEMIQKRDLMPFLNEKGKAADF